MFPRWLPLYLLGLASITLFPFAPGVCPNVGWVMHFAPFDFVANLLVFVPLGIALRRGSWLRALVLGLGLSLAIEVSQHWLPRQQDVGDLIANTFGAGVGYVLARAWTRRWPGPLLRPASLRLGLWIATPLLLAWLVVDSLGSPKHGFENWEHYPLVIGNSSNGSRPWAGTLREIRIYDRDLGAGKEPTSGAQPGEPALWMQGGPILWLRFSPDDSGSGVSGRIDGPDGPVRYEPRLSPTSAVLPSGLELRPSGITLASWVSDHVVDRLRATGRLTLDVRMRAATGEPYAMGYLLSLDDGRHLRDLMLGQIGSTLIAGLRTPANGRSGIRAQAETPAGVVTGKEQDVRLGYDGVHAVIRVDGACKAASDLMLVNASLLRGPLLGATILLCTALPALLVGSGVRGTRRRLAFGAAAGVAAWLFCWSIGAWGHVLGFEPAALALGLLALAASVPLLVPSQ